MGSIGGDISAGRGVTALMMAFDALNERQMTHIEQGRRLLEERGAAAGTCTSVGDEGDPTNEQGKKQGKRVEERELNVDENIVCPCAVEAVKAIEESVKEVPLVLYRLQSKSGSNSSTHEVVSGMKYPGGGGGLRDGEERGERAVDRPYAFCRQRRTATGLTFYELMSELEHEEVGLESGLMSGVYTAVQAECKRLNATLPKGQKATLLPWDALVDAELPPGTPLV